MTRILLYIETHVKTLHIDSGTENNLHWLTHLCTLTHAFVDLRKTIVRIFFCSSFSFEIKCKLKHRKSNDE